MESEIRETARKMNVRDDMRVLVRTLGVGFID